MNEYKKNLKLKEIHGFVIPDFFNFRETSQHPSGKSVAFVPHENLKRLNFMSSSFIRETCFTSPTPDRKKIGSVQMFSNTSNLHYQK